MAVGNADTMPDEFFPGIRWAGQLAPGSTASRTPPPDTAVPAGDSGLPGTGTALPLRDQSGAGEGASTSQPGQVGTSIISPGPAQGYVQSGAGGGEPIVDTSHRYPWQQRPQGR